MPECQEAAPQTRGSKRFLPVFLLAALWTVFWTALLPAAPLDAQTPKRTGTKKPRSKVTPPPKQETVIPNIPIPGAGGGIPLRKKPASPPLVPPGDRSFPQSLQPATVFGPNSQGLPGLPGVPGLPGLQTRLVSRLLYGVNVAWGENGGITNWDRDKGAKARRLAQLLRGANATNVRLHLRWSDIEPTRGKYDWRETDGLVRYISGLGLTLLAVVDSAPSWTKPALGPDIPSPTYYIDWGRFAFALAQRYKGRIGQWECWQHPDLMPDRTGSVTKAVLPLDPKAYSAVLRVFAQNVKLADPTSQIAIGGLREPSTDYLNSLYQNGAKPYFDAIAVHPSVPREGLNFAWIDRCHELAIKNGDGAKPFWVTEWGWPVGPSATNREAVTESHQARLIRQSLAGMRDRPYIIQASYQSLNDWRLMDHGNGTVLTTGLAAANLMPRPALQAFREMVSGLNPEAVNRFTRVGLIGGLPAGEQSGLSGTAVHVTVDAGKPGAILPPLWEGFSQGYEPGAAARVSELSPRLKALKAQLVRFDPFPMPDAIRTEGTTTAALSSPPPFASSQINWQYADAMVAAITQSGAKPMLVFATMPSVLSSAKGNPHLPRDMNEWTGFVQTVVRRYNREQKRGIVYWELGSEPNRGNFTLSEWLPLYKAFAHAVTAADPNARVGGPGLAGFNEEWLSGLAGYCDHEKVPLHFVSWHAYDLAPPEYARQMNLAKTVLQRYPASKNTERFISEWNVRASASPEHDGMIAATHAASVIEQLAETTKSADGIKSLFYEVREGPDLRRPDAALTGRWGLLTREGQPKAVYHAFQLLSHLIGKRLPADSEETDIHALATRQGEKVALLLWSDPSMPSASPIPDQPLNLRIRGLPWTMRSISTQGKLWTLDSQNGDLQTNPTHPGLTPPLPFQAPVGDIELPLVIPSNALVLVELTPAEEKKVELSVETPRYLVAGGSRFPLIARLRNPGTTPQKVALYAGRHDAKEQARATQITLAGGETQAVSLAYRAAYDKNDRAEAQRFYTITALPVSGSVPAPSSLRPDSPQGGISAGVGVKIIAPLQARVERLRADVARPDSLPDSSNATVQFRVVLENFSDEDRKVNLEAGMTTLVATVPANRRTTIPFVLPSPSSTPGSYPETIRVLQGTVPIASLPVTIGVPSINRYAVRTPRINGDLSEWTEASTFPLLAVTESGTPAPLSTSFTAQAATLWDEKRFYLALTINDTVPVNADSVATRGTAPSLPQVQFLLTEESAARTAPPTVFVLDNTRWGARLYRMGADQRLRGDLPPGQPVEGAQVVVQQIGSRTIYEIALPWQETALSRPAAGALAGFSLRVNDTHGAGRAALQAGSGDILSPTAGFRLRLLKK